MSGGGSKAPKDTSVTQSNIPQWAIPYATRLLDQGSALTDINQNPFVPYGGQQVAGFSPLQQQGYTGLQQQGVAGQIGQATGFAGLAGLQAQQGGNFQASNYQPGQVGIQDYTGDNVSRYMSPYMEQVVNQQQQGAIRDYARELPGLASTATQVGGLGGTRQALMESEAQRNLQDRLGDIRASGLQSAFGNAQQQFNAQQGAQLQADTTNQQYGLGGAQLRDQSNQFGSNMGLQYLQQQLGAGQLLGELGTQQYNQQTGINRNLIDAGSQQRSLEQQYLDAQRAQFDAQQNYPYQQLGFMSDILHGVPSTSSAQTIYGRPANQLGQLAGLGVGLGSLFSPNAAQQGPQ